LADAAQERRSNQLGRTHLPDPQAVFDSYPHQLSGACASARSWRWRCLRARRADRRRADDGPDVTTQEQIVDLLREIQEATRSR